MAFLDLCPLLPALMFFPSTQFQVFSALSVFHWVTYQNISNANKSTFLHIYIWCFSCLKSLHLSSFSSSWHFPWGEQNVSLCLQQVPLSAACSLIFFQCGFPVWLRVQTAAWDTFLMVIMSFSGLGFAVWFMRFRLNESQLIKTPGFAEYTQVAHTNMISHVKWNQINIYLSNSK